MPSPLALESHAAPAIPIAGDYSGRDRAIDVLRGICLVSMILGHITYATSGRSILTQLWHLPLYVDGAAGFVFLSGVSVALAQAGRARRGDSQIRRSTALFRRAGYLYLLHAVLTLGMIGWFSATSWPVWAEGALGSGVVLSVLAFGTSLPFMNILPLYVVCLVLSPLALRSPRVFGAMSVLVYAASQIWPGITSIQSGSETAWVIGAWQLLYFTGLLAGSNWPAVRRQATNVRWLVVAAVGLLVLLTLRFGRAVSMIDALQPQLSKPNLPPLTVALVLVFGAGTYSVVARLVHRVRLNWLECLGRQSLRVYMASSVMVGIWAVASPEPVRLVAEIAAVAAVGLSLLIAVVPGDGRVQLRAAIEPLTPGSPTASSPARLSLYAKRLAPRYRPIHEPERPANHSRCSHSDVH